MTIQNTQGKKHVQDRKKPKSQSTLYTMILIESTNHYQAYFHTLLHKLHDQSHIDRSCIYNNLIGLSDDSGSHICTGHCSSNHHSSVQRLAL